MSGQDDYLYKGLVLPEKENEKKKEKSSTEETGENALKVQNEGEILKSRDLSSGIQTFIKPAYFDDQFELGDKKQEEKDQKEKKEKSLTMTSSSALLTDSTMFEPISDIVQLHTKHGASTLLARVELNSKEPPTLESIIGPMSSGKTTELIRRVRKREHCNVKVFVVKHELDDKRYTKGHENLVSHDGQSMKTHLYGKLFDIKEQDLTDYHAIAIDEAQWFPDLKDFCLEQIIRRGRSVLFSALDRYADDTFFGQVMEVATFGRTTHLTAICKICFRDTATLTEKIVATNPGDDKNCPGGLDMYRAVCTFCKFTTKCFRCQSNLTATDLKIQTQMRYIIGVKLNPYEHEHFAVISDEKLAVPLCLACNMLFGECTACHQLLHLHAITNKEDIQYKAICQSCKKLNPITVIASGDPRARLTLLS